jgi:hypothetical protein
MKAKLQDEEGSKYYSDRHREISHAVRRMDFGLEICELRASWDISDAFSCYAPDLS